MHIRPVAAGLSALCGLAPGELEHLEPAEREPLDQLAVRLGQCIEHARPGAQARKYAQQQETLRELVLDRSLSPQARTAVVSGWWSTPAPGYWLQHFEQLTGTPPEQRDRLYCQAERLLSLTPARVREGLAELPPESSVAACQSVFGAQWAPPADATHGQLAAAAQVVHLLARSSMNAHAVGMLRGLFQADLAPVQRQKGLELVGDRLHALQFKDDTDFVSRVHQVLDHPELSGDVRLAVLEQLGPDTVVEHAVEAAVLRFGALAKPPAGVHETPGFVAFNGIMLRKRS